MPSPLNVRARVRPWVDDLLRRSRDRRSANAAGSDALSGFSSERRSQSKVTLERVIPIGLGAIAALLVVGVIGLVQKRFVAVDAAERTLAKLSVESRPAGAEVLIDGRHAWLRVDPEKIISWDFRKMAGNTHGLEAAT